MALIQIALLSWRTTKILMARILGLLVHPFMHHRVLAASLRHVYGWQPRLPEVVTWDPIAREELPQMMRPTEVTRPVLLDTPWVTGRSYQHPRSAHINIQEMREVTSEIRSRADRNLDVRAQCQLH